MRWLEKLDYGLEATVFDFQRLAKEDYELLGRCHTWTTWDAKVMLASFELESSGGFGGSSELFQFERLTGLVFVEGVKYEGVEKVFREAWDKWEQYVSGKLGSVDLPYANTPMKGDGPEPVGVVSEDHDVCNISPRDLISCLREDVAKPLDVSLLAEFLRGRGNAPSRLQTMGKAAVLHEYFSEQARKKISKAEPRHEALWQFLMDDLSGGCTCTKVQACERIYRVRYRSSKDYLKDQTGYGHLMFTRRVSAALITIEERDKTGINRHENTPGFSAKNVPPCLKHSNE